MMIVIGGAAPTARFIARVQLTLVLVPLQLQSVPEALWKITPAGSVSLTVIGRSEERRVGKECRTVWVPDPYTTNGSGLSLLLISRSADTVTVVCSVALLLPVWASLVADDTVTVLLIGPPSAGVFFLAEDGIRADLVTGVQTCALPILLVPLQLQSVPEALWKITPAGSVSLTVIG